MIDHPSLFEKQDSWNIWLFVRMTRRTWLKHTIKLTQTQIFKQNGYYGNSHTKTKVYSLQLLQDLHFYKVVQSENANIVDTSEGPLVQATLLNSNYWLIWTSG